MTAGYEYSPGSRSSTSAACQSRPSADTATFSGERPLEVWLYTITWRPSASVTLWSEPNRKYAAKLREIAPNADPSTRTYLAKFSLPDAGEQVSLGMTATLTLSDPATARVARLPLSALFSQGNNPSLYTVDAQGAVALQPVKVKAYETNDVVIAGGVDDGAKVVVLGVQKLDPAQKVRIVSALTF